MAQEDLQWVEGRQLLLIWHDVVFLQSSVLVLIDVHASLCWGWGEVSLSSIYGVDGRGFRKGVQDRGGNFATRVWYFFSWWYLAYGHGCSKNKGGVCCVSFFPFVKV